MWNLHYGENVLRKLGQGSYGLEEYQEFPLERECGKSARVGPCRIKGYEVSLLGREYAKVSKVGP